MTTPSPMLVLFTDFGADGPYVGQVKAVLAQQAPDVPVIDLLHNAPAFDVLASAHLLAAYVAAFPPGSVFLGVVDPGVGSEQRQPIVAKIAGRWFVGPGNGLFDVLAARTVEAQEKLQCWEIEWRPENLSHTFHGRDLFAPIAARLAGGDAPQGDTADWPWRILNAADDLAAVIFIDHFGNVVTGLRASKIKQTTQLRLGDHQVRQARTFSEVTIGQAFWYENANGLVEIAVNQGHAAAVLSVQVGTSVSISAI